MAPIHIVDLLEETTAVCASPRRVILKKVEGFTGTLSLVLLIKVDRRAFDHFCIFCTMARIGYVPLRKRQKLADDDAEV